MSELKACRICGSKARPVYENSFTYEKVTGCSNLSCALFHVSVPVDEWNTRPLEDALLQRAEVAEKEVADLVSVIQRYQPAGSPPPGGSFILVDWVLSSLQQRAEAAEARVRELDLLLREAIGGAAWESCEYKDYEIAIPTWNCCDWSEWVREVAEKLGIKLP